MTTDNLQYIQHLVERAVAQSSLEDTRLVLENLVDIVSEMIKEAEVKCVTTMTVKLANGKTYDITGDKLRFKEITAEVV